MTNHYPRESIEFVATTVTVNGSAVTSGVKLSIVAQGDRPTTWITPTTISTEIGFMVGTYAPGYWDVYAQITSSPEVPVLYLDTIIID